MLAHSVHPDFWREYNFYTYTLQSFAHTVERVRRIQI